VFAPTDYLRWAVRFYGQVEHDLASSGTPTAPIAALGPLPALDDGTAWGRLRERIAAHNGVPAREAIPALGTSHALFTAYAALLSPGDELLIERPAYEPLFRIAEGLGARVTWFERPPAERFALDPERVRAAISPRTRAVVITNLHNPGGVRASDEEILAVARIAEQSGAYLIVDEVYAPFDSMCDAGGRWDGSARRLAANIIVVSSLTKVYGVGPLRIGWMLAPPDVIARGEDAQMSNLGHAPFSWAALGVAAFDHLPALAARSRALLGGKRARVEAWIAQHPHLSWSGPREGLFGFALDARGGDLTAAIERGARESGVLVAAGSFFGMPSGFRLSWSIDEAKLAAALETLARVIV
jgi:aspartate/methionine/tyrosine aminotransferase